MEFEYAVFYQADAVTRLPTLKPLSFEAMIKASDALVDDLSRIELVDWHLYWASAHTEEPIQAPIDPLCLGQIWCVSIKLALDSSAPHEVAQCVAQIESASGQALDHARAFSARAKRRQIDFSSLVGLTRSLGVDCSGLRVLMQSYMGLIRMRTGDHSDINMKSYVSMSGELGWHDRSTAQKATIVALKNGSGCPEVEHQVFWALKTGLSKAVASYRYRLRLNRSKRWAQQMGLAWFQ